MATALQNTGPAQFVHPTTGLPVPPLGLQVSGRMLTAFTGQKPAAEGSYAYGVGIFFDPDSLHPYVVWTLILRPESEGAVWVAEQGDYCQGINEAVEAYERRGGRA